jgi:3-oxoacyl-(acyl-carrier-protein) synthase
MPAEAAASFAIERLDRAVDREVQIYGEILASGSATAIKSNHQAIPDEAVAGAIKNALHQTKLDPQSIASIQMDRQSNVLRDRVDEIGDAAAGSSGLSIAALLLAFRHGHSLSPIASNIDAMDNGLASCLIFGNGNITSEQRRAA